MSTTTTPKRSKLFFCYMNDLCLTTTSPQRKTTSYNNGVYVVNKLDPIALHKATAKYLGDKAEALGFITTENIPKGWTTSKRLDEMLKVLNGCQEEYKFVKSYTSPDFANRNYFLGNYLNFIIVKVLKNV